MASKKKTTKKTRKTKKRKKQPDKIPPGFELLHTLRGHKGNIWEIAFSPDGLTLASGSEDMTICLWDTASGKLRQTLAHPGSVYSVSWSPDGRILTSGLDDTTVCFWDAVGGQLQKILKEHRDSIHSVSWSPNSWTFASGSNDRTINLWYEFISWQCQALKGHTNIIYGVSWSPDGRTLASGSCDKTVRLWDTSCSKLLQTLKGHTDYVYNVSWSPDGQILASGSADKTIRLWDATGGRLSVLEGHTDGVIAVHFSPDGRLLASKSDDNTVRLWQTDTSESLAILAEPTKRNTLGSLAFHPTEPILATLGEGDEVIRIWRLDYDKILGVKAKPRKPAEQASHYTNAKVVLVGNTSVGKTGLGLVLAGRKFRATESSHGRHVWMFDEKEIELKPKGASARSIKSTRETLLWDLAGQPGYRLIHQLCLHEVAVALVLFDSRSETEPFAGVSYWARALDEATGDFPLVKYLVAARIDRGGVAVSKKRIDEVVAKYGFDGFIETSAKRSDGVAKLTEVIRKKIAEVFNQIAPPSS